MKKAGNFLEKCIAWLFAAIMGLLLVLVLFFQNMRYLCKRNFLLPNIALVCMVLVLWVLFTAAGRWVSRRRVVHSFWDAKKLDRAVAWASVCLFLAQLYIVFNIFFLTAWDPGTVWRTALSFVEENPWPWGVSYFSRYPNNLLLLLTETTLLKLHYKVGFLPEPYTAMCCIWLDCAAISLACYLTYRELCLFTRRRYALAGFLLCAILAGFSPWMCVFYSDSLGILFPILTLYLYSKPRKTRPGAAYGKAAAVVVGCIGYFLKPQCLIPVIGILCVELIRLLQEKRIQRAGSFALLLLLAVVTIKLTGGLLVWGYESNGVSLDSEEAIGASHFLMMGLNEETDGIYSEEDMQYSASFVTAKERRQANLSVAAARLRQMGPVGLAQHFAKKLLIGYNDGTFFWGGDGNFFPNADFNANNWMAPRLKALFYPEGHKSPPAGQKYPYLALAEQTAWISVLLFTGCFGLASLKKSAVPGLSVLKLTVVGAVLFMMLFETRARYAFLNVPIFCVLAALGMEAAASGVSRRSSLTVSRKGTSSLF